MSLHMSNAQQETEEQKSSKLPFLLDPGTKGGAVFLSIVLFFIPLIGYQVATTALGIDEVEAGKWIGVGFTVVSLLLWAASYIFRVATKDMTYVCIKHIIGSFIIRFLWVAFSSVFIFCYYRLNN